MTAPRTPGRVSPVIPVQTPAGATLLAVGHDDHTCIALQVGRRNAIHSFRLDRRGHAALLTALLDWHLCADALPNAYHPVLLAGGRGDDEIVKAYHDGSSWRCVARGIVLFGDCYAWAPMPLPPARRSS